MSRSAHTSRKGSSHNEGRTSRASSGIVEDYSSRPDTASAKQRDRMRISLTDNERAKPVPMSTSLPVPGRISPGSKGRMSALEFLQNTRTDEAYANGTLNGKTARFKTEDSSKDSPWYVTMLQEKEDRILQMGGEISRLHAIDTEIRQKDDQIAELRRQLTQIAMARTNQDNLTESIIIDLKTRIQLLSDEIVRIGAFEEESKKKGERIHELQQKIKAIETEKESSAVLGMGVDEPAVELVASSCDGRSTVLSERLEDISSENFAASKDHFDQKVESLRESVRSATADVAALQDEFDNLVPEKLTPEDEVIFIKDELSRKMGMIEDLERQLKESQKELILNEGLVQALQRDVLISENKVMKLTTQIEKSEIKMREAIAESKAMSKKFSDLRESRKHNDIIATNEHELNLTKDALRESQNRIEKMKAKMEKQSKELRDYHRKVRRGNELDRKQGEEIKNLCRDLEDIRRREQLSRVSAEQSSSRFERLRSRIIQAVYTTPGAAIPESCINDGLLFNAVKKIIKDRSVFHQKILETQSDYPPLQIELETASDSEKLEETTVVTPGNAERKSGKGGRKSPKHR